MFFGQEKGFQGINDRFNFVRNLVKKANIELSPLEVQLHLNIVDACNPARFRQGSCVLLTNNWIAPGQLDSNRYQQFPNNWYGVYSGSAVWETTIPTKKFNCFINRMDPIRQSWLYQLIRRGVFDQGLISFNMDISRHTIGTQCGPTDTPYQVFEQQFQQHLQIFHNEHNFIKSQVPFRNFDVSLDQAIMQTEFSIVLETYFDPDQVITVSEKIFRCLKLPRPWVIFAMKNTVAYLRDMGFDVLDDVVDHSYDRVEHDIERQVKLLDQIQYMCERTLTPAEIKKCEQAAEHNHQLLNKMFSTWYTDMATSCSLAVEKCKNLKPTL